jgi:hypothetical protein
MSKKGKTFFPTFLARYRCYQDFGGQGYIIYTVPDTVNVILAIMIISNRIRARRTSDDLMICLLLTFLPDINLKN